jgi:hypothetical protein
MHNNKIVRLKLLKERWAIQPSTKTKLDHTIYQKTLNYIFSLKPKKYIALY